MKIVALCAIIGICLIFSLSQLFGGKKDVVFTVGYQCQDCQEQFTMTNIEAREMEVDRALLEQDKTRSADQAHCPKCGKKHTGMVMIKCPKCSHFYLPTKVNLRLTPNAVVPPPVCPKCGTDRNQWHEEQAKP